MNQNLQRATEENVPVTLDKYIVIQETDLDIINTQVPFTKEAQIYFICRRPRLYVNPNSLIVTEQHLCMTFGRQEKAEFLDKLEIPQKNIFGRTDLLLKSTYPYTYFSIQTLDKKVDYNAKASAWIDHWGLPSQEKGLLDLEVLYVGKGVSDNAADRLKHHETLQKISSHTLAHHPDSELWTLMATFHKGKSHINIIVKGDVELTDEQEQEDCDRFLNLIKKGGTRISKGQQINLIEAALIRYFQPAYNNDFVKTFPSRAHTSYSEYYAAGINSILVELDTTERGFQLFSTSIPKKDYHRSTFYL